MAPRILVVDDSPTILKVVSAILARNGYGVEVARDGLAGLEQLGSKGPFDLVLLDFVMPKLNGYQFCRELRQNPKYKPVPVILMSAKGDRIRDQFVQQTSALDAITKPFDARGLVAVVEGALAKLKAGRAPIVPEGETLPEESSLDDDSRPSLLPIKLERRAAAELARHVTAVCTPALLEMPDGDRKSAELIGKAITRAITSSPLDSVLQVLREALSGATREVLSGDLSLVPLAEVLQLLQMQRQSGVMRVVSGSKQLWLSVRDGAIDFAQNRNERPDYWLGRYFVQTGALARSDVDAAVAAAKSAKRKLGDDLVARGRVTDAERRAALEKQTCEIIYDLVLWQSGRFWFAKDAFAPEAEEAKLGLPVSGLVLEGFRRVDEWRLMEGTIVWDQVVMVDESAQSRVSAQLTRHEQGLLSAFDGKRTINEVISEAEISRFDALKIVYQFLSSRVLKAVA
ncbi:MAG: response regulator [Polyangiaceae bacterium]|nr:response regulator [Polyangiaceae bacterium]